jgi:hypothetical protein
MAMPSLVHFEQYSSFPIISLAYGYIFMSMGLSDETRVDGFVAMAGVLMMEAVVILKSSKISRTS